MKTKHLIIPILSLGVLLFGCTSGLIYTHTVRPLDVNQDRTSAVQTSEKGDIRYLRIPLLARGQIDILWHSNAIGDIAKKNGMETIHYADLETLSILTVWNQYTVHVYGQ